MCSPTSIFWIIKQKLLILKNINNWVNKLFKDLKRFLSSYFFVFFVKGKKTILVFRFHCYIIDMEQKSSFNANTSLVLGILSIALCFTRVFSIVGIVLGIIGIVLSHSLRKTEQVAQTGFILSIIGLSLNSVLIVFLVAIFGFLFMFI